MENFTPVSSSKTKINKVTNPNGEIKIGEITLTNPILNSNIADVKRAMVIENVFKIIFVTVINSPQIYENERAVKQN